MVFNAFVMLLVPLYKRWKCCMKNVSQHVDSFFQCLIEILHKALKTKDNVSPRCNKAKHIGNTTNSTLFTSNIMLNIKILHLREFDFVWLIKRYLTQLTLKVLQSNSQCNPPEMWCYFFKFNVLFKLYLCTDTVIVKSGKISRSVPYKLVISGIPLN